MSHFSSGPTLTGVTTAAHTESKPAQVPVPGDAERRTARLCAYGIATVFALMLILLVVVGSMLWAG